MKRGSAKRKVLKRTNKEENDGKGNRPTSFEEGKEVRLNRFLAHAGLCSRREADDLIASGQVRINGKQVKELGTKVILGKDIVTYKGATVQAQDFVYILFNKPKNVISTLSDPEGRKTVIDIIQPHFSQRVYPVGRLDRNTTGLLLLTNDGMLTKKLTHPSHKVKKMYKVRLNKNVEEEDLQRLLQGIELEDGIAKVNKADYVLGANGDEVGLEIHMGKNRIVRRMFEQMGYQVLSLDRVSIAHLTKKNLPRGKWRLLSGKEISFLKMI